MGNPIIPTGGYKPGPVLAPKTSKVIQPIVPTGYYKPGPVLAPTASKVIQPIVPTGFYQPGPILKDNPTVQATIATQTGQPITPVASPALQSAQTGVPVPPQVSPAMQSAQSGQAPPDIQQTPMRSEPVSDTVGPYVNAVNAVLKAAGSAVESPKPAEHWWIILLRKLGLVK